MSEETTFSCRLCHGTQASPWLSRCPDYYLCRHEPVDYVCCDTCGLVQQYPLPSDIGALYADYPVHKARSAMQRLARRVFHRQVYFRAGAPAGAECLLDFGCGDGAYLLEAGTRFARRLGYEPDPQLADAIRQRLGATIFSDEDLLRHAHAGSVDIVTAHFVLEHVTDLHRAFETFHQVLKPGGLLHVAVPNIRSWEARCFGHKWHGLDAPRHLVFPERKHFITLAAQHGFDDPSFRHAAFPNTLAASLIVTALGRMNAGLLMPLVVPCWLIALLFPSGTLVATMRKKSCP